MKRLFLLVLSLSLFFCFMALTVSADDVVACDHNSNNDNIQYTFGENFTFTRVCLNCNTLLKNNADIFDFIGYSNDVDKYPMLSVNYQIDVNALEAYKAAKNAQALTYKMVYASVSMLGEGVTPIVSETGLPVQNNGVAVWDNINTDYQNVSAIVRYTSEKHFFEELYLCLYVYDGENTYYVTDGGCTGAPTPVSFARVDSKLVNSDKYLYRAGNKNAVSLSSLFNIDANTIGYDNFTVEVTSVSGNVSSTFTENSSFAESTLKFDGTGVVKVAVKFGSNEVCAVYLEIVNAKNITSAESSIYADDVVLLNDVKVSSGGRVNYFGCTVYGNGFTFDVRGGATQYEQKQGWGVIMLNGATIDNLVIIGDIYREFGAYNGNSYNAAAVDSQNSVIQNCYISGCAAPVISRGESTVIKNSTLYGGTVANLIIKGGTNTLENVTTANFDDGRDLVGLGIVIHSDATNTTKLVLNGTLEQYNFICEANVPSDTYAKALYDGMFSSSCSNYHFGTSPNRYVNTGIVSMINTFDSSDITDNTRLGYVGTSVKINGSNGYVYTQPNTIGSVNNDYSLENDSNISSTQSNYKPTFDFDLGSQAVTGEDRYLKYENGIVSARYIKGESAFTLDLTKLATVYKYTDINFDVTTQLKDANGNVIAKDSTVTLSNAGSYTIVFTVTDDCFYDGQGNKTGETYVWTYEVPLDLVIAEPTIKDAIITVNKTALDGSYSGLSDQTASFNPLSAITITDAEGTVTLTTNIASTSISYASSSSAYAGATTITVNYKDGRVLTITLGKPTLNSPGSSKAITYANDGTVKSVGAVAKKSATGGTWTVTSYSFKGTNGKTVTNNTVVTFTFPDKSSCVTGDTLVMLADGTQKRIDQVTYNDQLLVWNFFEGEYATVPASIIFYHGDDVYSVLELKFSDGTTVKTINTHGFFDMDANEFVFIDEESVSSFLGHRFVKVNGNSYENVELVSYEIYDEYTGCYSIQSAVYNNFIVEGMFSTTIPYYEGWFDYFAIGEDMRYDEDKMQEDIEKYGLYTYDEFKDYVTYEQFIAFNGPYLKVLVGRGVVTFEQILTLIETYVA